MKDSILRPFFYVCFGQSKELEMGPIAAVHVKIQALSEQDFDNFSWIDPNYLERSTKQLFMVRTSICLRLMSIPTSFRASAEKS